MEALSYNLIVNSFDTNKNELDEQQRTTA